MWVFSHWPSCWWWMRSDRSSAECGGALFGICLIPWSIYFPKLVLCQEVQSWSTYFWHTCFQLFIWVEIPHCSSAFLLRMCTVCLLPFQKRTFMGSFLARWQAAFWLQGTPSFTVEKDLGMLAKWAVFLPRCSSASLIGLWQVLLQMQDPCSKSSRELFACVLFRSFM